MYRYVFCEHLHDSWTANLTFWWLGVSGLLLILCQYKFSYCHDIIPYDPYDLIKRMHPHDLLIEKLGLAIHVMYFLILMLLIGRSLEETLCVIALTAYLYFFRYWDPYYYRRRRVRADNDGMNFIESVIKNFLYIYTTYVSLVCMFRLWWWTNSLSGCFL